MTNDSKSESLAPAAVDWASVYRWVLGTAAVVTLLKGFRFPNLFAATHFVLNYSAGFARRALLGEVMQWVFGSWAYTYNLFAAFSFALLGFAAFAFFVSARRVLSRDPNDVLYRLALLAFVTSPALVFFVHVVGYLDYVGLVAVLLVLGWAPRSRGTWGVFFAVGACGAVFAFVHEILAVMFMVPLGFVMMCHILRRWNDEAPTQRGAMVAAAVMAFGLAFGLSAIVGTMGTQTKEAAAQLQAGLATKVDFPLRADPFEALCRSSAENLTVLMPWYWRHSPLVQLAPKSWLAALPGVLYLLRYGTGLVSRLNQPGWARWLLWLLLLGSVVGPQLLNFVGWDWARWNSISLLGCFLCITTAKLYFPEIRWTGSATSEVIAGAVTLVLSLASTTYLYDLFAVQFFPFDEQLKFIQQWVQSGFKYLPPF